jgi:protein TonB
LGGFPALISGKSLPKQLQLSIGKSGIRSAPTAITLDRAPVAFKPNADAYYLRSSKFAGEDGDVVITLIVGIDGIVEDVLLIKSSGFSRLDQSAARAGYDYRFNSYLIDGVPSRIAVNALFRFKVEKPPLIKNMDAIRTQ